MHDLFVSLILALSMTWTPNGMTQAPLGAVMLAQAQEISAEEAARRAKEKYGGKVLSSRLVEPGDEPSYFRVKLIADGTVRVVRIENRR